MEVNVEEVSLCRESELFTSAHVWNSYKFSTEFHGFGCQPWWKLVAVPLCMAQSLCGWQIITELAEPSVREDGIAFFFSFKKAARKWLHQTHAVALLQRFVCKEKSCKTFSKRDSVFNQVLKRTVNITKTRIAQFQKAVNFEIKLIWWPVYTLGGCLVLRLGSMHTDKCRTFLPLRAGAWGGYFVFDLFSWHETHLTEKYMHVASQKGTRRKESLAMPTNLKPTDYDHSTA